VSSWVVSSQGRFCFPEARAPRHAIVLNGGWDRITLLMTVREAGTREGDVQRRKVTVARDQNRWFPKPPNGHRSGGKKRGMLPELAMALRGGGPNSKINEEKRDQCSGAGGGRGYDGGLGRRRRSR